MVETEHGANKPAFAAWLAGGLAAVIAAIVLIAIVTNRGGRDAADADRPSTSTVPASSTTVPDESPPPADQEATDAADSTTPLSRDFVGQEITVFVIDNGATDALQRLTESHFTPGTGLVVDFTSLPEQELRERVTFPGSLPTLESDVRMIGPFDAPQLGGINEWLVDLTPFAEEHPTYDLADITPAIREANSLNDGFYAAPFFAESSFLMYNQEIMDAAGVTVPDNPTWTQVAEIAARVHSDDVAGICLRGQSGWADLGASLTTVVNTFGGTWWEETADGLPGEPQINQPDSAFRAATEFYVDLAQNYGQDNAANSSFPQCLELMQSGGAAMWFDSTSAAGILENQGLTGNLGVARAPTGPTGLPGGWLWSWGLGISEPTSATIDRLDAAWEFVRWATSKEFIELLGEEEGWETAPLGTRLSTLDNPSFQAATESFADVAVEELLASDPNNPGTTPRPGLPGVQYVGIPEFQDIGTRCTQEISAAIAGTITVDQALDTCQTIAAEISQ